MDAVLAQLLQVDAFIEGRKQDPIHFQSIKETIQSDTESTIHDGFSPSKRAFSNSQCYGCDPVDYMG